MQRVGETCILLCFSFSDERKRFVILTTVVSTESSVNAPRTHRSSSTNISDNEWLDKEWSSGQVGDAFDGCVEKKRFTSLFFRENVLNAIEFYLIRDVSLDGRERKTLAPVSSHTIQGFRADVRRVPLPRAPRHPALLRDGERARRFGRARSVASPHSRREVTWRRSSTVPSRALSSRVQSSAVVHARCTA